MCYTVAMLAVLLQALAVVVVVVVAFKTEGGLVHAVEELLVLVLLAEVLLTTLNILYFTKLQYSVLHCVQPYYTLFWKHLRTCTHGDVPVSADVIVAR
jgi:hypothetical protein